MKYGDYFETESVPRWSLHNIDYNALKQAIKTQTTKQQVTAITIPGQTDDALEIFEHGFYNELCRQHDRVGLFVSSKSSEIGRRLRYLDELVQRLLIRCTDTRGLTTRRRTRFARYQQQIVDCGQDIADLQRFTRAQSTAFHKILKKYQKWTASNQLGCCFKRAVLNRPKSFTKHDLHALQAQYQHVLAMLRAASPGISSPVWSRLNDGAMSSSAASCRESPQSSHTPTPIQSQIGYWNEYDHGSETGDEPYTICVNHSGVEHPILNWFAKPFGVCCGFRPLEKKRSYEAETRPLISSASDPPTDYFGTHQSTAVVADNEEDEVSSTDYPVRGYGITYAALPSVEQQRVERYRERIFHRTIIVFFSIAVVVLQIAGVLIATGRHKMHVEVDAAVTLAVVTGLFSACIGLGAMLYRHDPLTWLYRATVWIAFVSVCVLNGALLVFMVGSNSAA